MEDKGRSAESLRKVKDAWSYFKQMVPKGVRDRGVFEAAGFRPHTGYSPAQVEIIKKSKFYEAWDNVCTGLHAEKKEFLRKRDAIEAFQAPARKKKRTRSTSAMD